MEGDWSDVLITDEASFYLLSSEKHRSVASGDSYEKKKTKYSQKQSCLGAFSFKGIIKLQSFTVNMDSKKHVEIFKYCKSDIDNLYPNGILLLWDNYLKHKSEISSDYYIENKIQLLKWLAYNLDLNPIENVWTNIKYKLRDNVYKKIHSLKSDIEEYWISCATHSSIIVDDFIRKRIDAWVLNKWKR